MSDEGYGRNLGLRDNRLVKAIVVFVFLSFEYFLYFLNFIQPNALSVKHGTFLLPFT
jgi:hypothetical protein